MKVVKGDRVTVRGRPFVGTVDLVAGDRARIEFETDREHWFEWHELTDVTRKGQHEDETQSPPL